jgi:hypothetical protein
MWCVKMSIPRDKFYDAMSDMGSWLSDAHIDTPHFSYSRDPAGEIRFRISFTVAGDADRFAERFHGSVLPQDFLLD